MAPAARYIARQYEACVDRSLDVEAIRLHLLSQGVARSPAQVAHDLDHVFSFHGYAASHPPAPAQCVRAFDKAIDQGRG